MSDKRNRKKSIFRRTSRPLQGPSSKSDLGLRKEDIFGPNLEKAPTLYFLGYFSQEGIGLALEQYGVYEKLRELGYHDFRIVMDTADPYRQRFALYHGQVGPMNLLIETLLSRKIVKLDDQFCPDFPERSHEVLVMEWLKLQQPGRAFSPERPRLPGQDYPGLGISRQVLRILSFACRRMKLTGVLSIPEHFHNAQIYSVAAYFFDPQVEGLRRALERDLMADHGLAKTSWAVDQGCVLMNGEKFTWPISEQLAVFHSRLKNCFASDEYLQAVSTAAEIAHFTVDEAAWTSVRRDKSLPF